MMTLIIGLDEFSICRSRINYPFQLLRIGLPDPFESIVEGQAAVVSGKVGLPYPGMSQAVKNLGDKFQRPFPI